MPANKNQLATMLREQLQTAHDFLEGTMADVTAVQAHWTPPGTANPLGATYVHVITREDVVVSRLLKGEAPLYATTWSDKVGVSEVPPVPSPDDPGDWFEWGRQVQLDLPAVRAYAQAVYAVTDDYLATVNDDALAQTLDLTPLGFSKPTVGQIISNFVITSAQVHCGEISCLKGLQGSKGYPI